MNVTPTFDRRYMTILIAVLIVVSLVLALNVLVWFSPMGGMMSGGMMGIGGMMNDMMDACKNMMQNFQGH